MSLPQYSIDSVLHYLSFGWTIHGAVGVEVHLAPSEGNRIVTFIIGLLVGVKVGRGSIFWPGVGAGAVTRGWELKIEKYF